MNMPEVEISGLTPYLMVGGDGAAAASAFWQEAFAAKELMRMPAEDGKRFMHACVEINGGKLMFCDAFPEHGYTAQRPEAVTLHLQVDDADAWWERAVGAGCVVTMPLENQFWGDRYGQLKDPFGFAWSIGCSLKG
jgi:PhnB protein